MPCRSAHLLLHLRLRCCRNVNGWSHLRPNTGDVQSYQPTLAALNQVDADAITFETCSSGTGDLKAIGEIITEKKIVIGVIDHHTLQVERPDQVADLIREALKYIPAERLIISSDCSMGREGMSRRHAAYKMLAMVLGTNIVRKELGLPEAECLAADPRFSLARNP
jgi:5-methyltetrahydropteroyltriglutamate--homocysteine methyltransferase